MSLENAASANVVFNAYLHTATGGNVQAFKAVLTSAGRWRLLCTNCEITLTVEDNIAIKYASEGVLDYKVQEFVKQHRHRHQKPEPVSAPVSAPASQKIKPETKPRKTEGRKFR